MTNRGLLKNQNCIEFNIYNCEKCNNIRVIYHHFSEYNKHPLKYEKNLKIEIIFAKIFSSF